MALAGDVYNTAVTLIAKDNYLNLKPDTGHEIVVHNINHGSDAALEFHDETLGFSIEIVSAAGSGSWMGMFLHCTNTRYYRVRGKTVATNYMAADGMYTKAV